MVVDSHSNEILNSQVHLKSWLPPSLSIAVPSFSIFRNRPIEFLSSLIDGGYILDDPTITKIEIQVPELEISASRIQIHGVFPLVFTPRLQPVYISYEICDIKIGT